MNLPDSLQSLSFGSFFNQSLEGVNLPDSLQSLSFGSFFNQSLEGVKFTCLTVCQTSLSFGKFTPSRALVEVKMPKDKLAELVFWILQPELGGRELA